MLKLASLYSTLGLIALVLANTGCRKEIDATEGTTISTEMPGWQRISISIIYNVYALEYFNNRLYIGGKFNYSSGGVATIMSYNPDNEVYYATSSSTYYEGSVYDFQIHNDLLYVAGDFHQSGSINMMTLYRIYAFGGLENVNFASYSPSTIYHLRSLGDTLIATGSFAPHPVFAPFIETQNVEFLIGNSHLPAADVTTKIHGSCVANNEIYVCGESGYFAYFTGLSWGTIDYPDQDASDIIYAIETIGSTIYLLGKFKNNVLIRSFNVNNGAWDSVKTLSCASSLELGAGFKWIDNELYVFGNDLVGALSGQTNIFKTKNGKNWKPLGTITEAVRDIVNHDGTFYAATPTGVFRFNH